MKRARKRRIWIINLVLIAAIGLVGIYYAVGMQEQQIDPVVTETAVKQEPANEEGPQGGDQVSSTEPDSEKGHTPDEESEDSDEQVTENSGGKSGESKPDATDSKANGKTDTGTKNRRILPLLRVLPVQRAAKVQELGRHSLLIRRRM